jgi:hypothetical protein
MIGLKSNVWLLVLPGNIRLIVSNTLANYSVTPMEQRALKIVNNDLNTNIYSYLETSGGQSSNLY